MGLGPPFASIQHKTSIVHHAISPKYLRETPREKQDGKLRILFVGNHFFDKGGRELFYAYQRLKKSYDVELVFVTSVPSHHRVQFEAFQKRLRSEPGVRVFAGGVSKASLWQEHYRSSDIFCFPTYMDTFGFVLLEAMANRLPIVATNMFSIPEIVVDGKTGLLVDAPIAAFEKDRIRTPETVSRYREAILDESLFSKVVDSLENALSLLLANDSLRRRLGESGFQEVREGRLSVTHRNRRLGEIYRRALE
jgi:glycosyltransferase involved in cell wall biosynthesis